MNILSRKKYFTAAILASGCVISLHAQEKPEADTQLQQKELSYGLGFQNGEQFASYGFIADDIDKDAYLKGLLDSLMKKDFANDPAAYEKAMKAFDTIVTEREKSIAAANEAAAKTFLEKNGGRKEVTTTASGLQYEILKKGEGKTYKAPEGTTAETDQLTQFYLICTATLLDGTVFTKTPADKPMPFNLQVIPGLAEAVKIMPVGSKWKLYLPAKLGFGDQRQGTKISPKSMLIYELELTDIQVTEPKPDQPQLLIPR